MTDSLETSRVLRMAAWMWLGYLVALAMVDVTIYAEAPRIPLPVVVYYFGNILVSLLFLGLSHWERLQKRLGPTCTPLMILIISVAPIILSHTFVPRFPPAPLSRAEGMTLRQMPILFIALILVAWEYSLPHVIAFGVGTAMLELFIVFFLIPFPPYVSQILFFITIMRTVSFLVVGVFISHLMTRLRQQSESLRQANVQLAHYTSTLENLTVSRERNRMARELHDTLAHTLTGLSVTLETVKAYWDVDVDQARTLLDKSLAATRNGLEETRRALKALRASPIEDLGLGLALRQLAQSAAARHQLDLKMALPDPLPALAPDVEQCFYRIAQEAVENVLHHANAKTLCIKLETLEDKLRLIVQDDGLGFDPRDKVSAGHFGLVGMKERAELAGGTLTINSQKGKGTEVVLEI